MLYSGEFHPFRYVNLNWNRYHGTIAFLRSNRSINVGYQTQASGSMSYKRSKQWGITAYHSTSIGLFMKENLGTSVEMAYSPGSHSSKQQLKLGFT